LVSETMLQQTQVATVIPYFHRFLAQFPTLTSLAEADEQDVLRLWQGLGYYSRARNLLKAAAAVVRDFGGRLPRERDELLTLPGVGMYTAGAIASIAFNTRAPIVDGNVARVLCRIDKVTADPRDKATANLLWARAEAILPDARPGDFNSALMELGATVCTPRNPQCLTCPARAHCEAQAAGVQESIPPPRKAKQTPLERRWTFCVVDHAGRFLIEQRPSTGRWAGMWQFLTVAADAKRKPAEVVAAAVGGKTSSPKALGQVTHALTHRRYEFDVFACRLNRATDDALPRRWVNLDELDAYPLPKPHVRVRGMLLQKSSA
jgi:A/G-specific adenine glycosylase